MTIDDPKGVLKNPFPIAQRLGKCKTCGDHFRLPDLKDYQCQLCWQKERDMDRFDLGDSGDEC